MLIKVENLSHVYAAGSPLEQRALSNVSLQIAPGERIGVVGRTGSGKSTLMQHLAGLLKPTSGQVLLDGVPAHGRSSAARTRRGRLGIAFQYSEEQIFERTVFREIGFGPRNLGIRGRELSDRVNWALALVGLRPDALSARSPFTLSGGEMRRVALASVLAMRPDVLILDEPTAGLDPQGRGDLLDCVTAWREDSGHTLIMVSHDLETMPRLVDRVILLSDGKVMSDGPTRSVLGNTDSLEAAGMSPPASVALLQRLHGAGWAVQTDKLGPEEVAKEIAEAHSRHEATSDPAGGAR
ncbi:MAG: energy-coupling factor transporter ATPase [Anaerolineae bacterium]|jgi:energy-coupling factor transport system ATP-binding protein